MTCNTSHIEGTHTCTGIEFGESCLLQCPVGYTGNTTQSCTYDSAENTTVSLQGDDLHCIGKPCQNASLAVGAQHVHDCEGKVTNETCTVSCAEGHEGDPVHIVCTASGMFEPVSDPIPACPVITSTSTISTTSVTHTETSHTETTHTTTPTTHTTHTTTHTTLTTHTTHTTISTHTTLTTHTTTHTETSHTETSHTETS